MFFRVFNKFTAPLAEKICKDNIFCDRKLFVVCGSFACGVNSFVVLLPAAFFLRGLFVGMNSWVVGLISWAVGLNVWVYGLNSRVVGLNVWVLGLNGWVVGWIGWVVGLNV